jgi:ParB family chromosome partitioning protein
MAFNIKNLLNEESLKQARNDRKKIHYSKLVPNPKNIYSISDIEELADSIEDSGLLQNLVVKENGDDTYEIVSGHRRWNATKLLVEERNHEEYAEVECLVLSKDEDELQTLLKLHTTNLLARNISEYEKMQAIKELEEIYTQLAEKGQKPKGKIRDLIAEQVDLKPTQVQKYMTISKKADDETLSDLEEGNITVEQAYKQAVSVKEEAPTEDTPKPNKAPQDLNKAIRKKVKALRVLLEDTDEIELLEYVHKMESILLERE